MAGMAFDEQEKDAELASVHREVKAQDLGCLNPDLDTGYARSKKRVNT